VITHHKYSFLPGTALRTENHLHSCTIQEWVHITRATDSLNDVQLYKVRHHILHTGFLYVIQLHLDFFTCKIHMSYTKTDQKDLLIVDRCTSMSILNLRGRKNISRHHLGISFSELSQVKNNSQYSTY